MRIDLYLHPEDDPRLEEILSAIEDLTAIVHKQGGRMSQEFDNLKAEVEELKVSSQAALDALAAARSEVADLKKLIEELGNAPTEAQIAEVKEQVNVVEDALEAGAQPPQG